MLCQASPVLVSNASQDDKVDVHKQLMEITEQWDTLESNWSKRKTELEQIYEIAVQFKTEVEIIIEWLVVEEEKFENMPAVGAKVGVVKEQLAEMRVSSSFLFLKFFVFDIRLDIKILIITSIDYLLSSSNDSFSIINAYNLSKLEVMLCTFLQQSASRL